MACARFAGRSHFAPKRSPRSAGYVIRCTRFPPCSALQFDENCRLSGRLGAYFCTRMGLDQASSNVTPSHPCQVFPSVAKPASDSRQGFCAPGFPPVCAYRILARFFRIAGANGRRNMRTLGEILTGKPAESWQCWQGSPQMIGKAQSPLFPSRRVLTRLVRIICQDRSLHFAS